MTINYFFLFDAEQIGHKLVVLKSKSLEFCLQIVVMVSVGGIIDCRLHNKFLEIASGKDGICFEIRSRLVV